MKMKKKRKKKYGKKIHYILTRNYLLKWLNKIISLMKEGRNSIATNGLLNNLSRGMWNKSIHQWEPTKDIIVQCDLGEEECFLLLLLDHIYKDKNSRHCPSRHQNQNIFFQRIKIWNSTVANNWRVKDGFRHRKVDVETHVLFGFAWVHLWGRTCIFRISRNCRWGRRSTSGCGINLNRWVIKNKIKNSRH